MSDNKKEMFPVWWMPVFVFILEGKPIKHKGVKLSNGTVALVLGVMYYFYNMDKKVCKASIDTISKKTGVSVKTVERCIHALESMGLIKDTTPTVKYEPHEYIVLEEAIKREHYIWYNTSPYLEKKNKKDTLVKSEEKVAFDEPAKVALDSEVKGMLKKLKGTLKQD